MPARLKLVFRTVLITLIERVSLTRYGVIYIGVILLFSLVYHILTPSQHGLVQPIGIEPVTGWTVLYFSICTITTVAYGDIVPLGFSRVLACLEAAFGITMFGIILAKVTSARIAYQVLRMYGSDAQNRLDGFCSQFNRLESELRSLLPEAGKAFQETPGGLPPTNRPAFLTAFSGAVASFHSISQNFCRYLKEELSQGGFYLTDAPKPALIKAGETADQAFYVLTQLLIPLGPQARVIVLDLENRKRITEGLASWREVCREVIQRSKDDEIKKNFQNVEGSCSRLTDSFFNVPVPPEELRQPDQTLGRADEPQG